MRYEVYVFPRSGDTATLLFDDPRDAQEMARISSLSGSLVVVFDNFARRFVGSFRAGIETVFQLTLDGFCGDVV